MPIFSSNCPKLNQTNNFPLTCQLILRLSLNAGGANIWSLNIPLHMINVWPLNGHDYGFIPNFWIKKCDAWCFDNTEIFDFKSNRFISSYFRLFDFDDCKFSDCHSITQFAFVLFVFFACKIPFWNLSFRNKMRSLHIQWLFILLNSQFSMETKNWKFSIRQKIVPKKERKKNCLSLRKYRIRFNGLEMCAAFMF